MKKFKDDCEMVDNYCDKNEFTLTYLEDLTIAIFKKIMQDFPGKIFLHVSEPDDRVTKFLKNNNIKVINGRPNELFFTRHT